MFKIEYIFRTQFIDIKRFIKINLRTMTSSTIVEKKNYLEPLKLYSKTYERIMFLKQIFDEEGHEIRIAGGAVRDILRNKEPLDIDFATTALPKKTREILESRIDVLRVFSTAAGERHGTVSAKFKDIDFTLNAHKKQKICHSPTYDNQSPFEITTLRCDKVTDGRHAEVEFVTDWKTDAERRDLTINAMFLKLDDGQLVDYFNGFEDLNNGVVKFVGDANRRIQEDYLRILRFYRFWARYGTCEPGKETIQAIESNRDGLQSISGERLWTETKKIFSHLPFVQSVELMMKSRITDYLGLTDPQINHSTYTKDAINQLQIVQDHISCYDKVSGDNSEEKAKDLRPIVAFASIVLSQTMFDTTYRRMKFSNIERDTIQLILSNKAKDIDLKTIKTMIAVAHKPDVATIKEKLKSLLIFKGKSELIDELNSWDVPDFPLQGAYIRDEARKHGVSQNKIKILIQSLKEEWAEKEYLMTEDELKESLISKCQMK